MQSDDKTKGVLKALPSSTVRLIGSSQVITSVFSVIKELVENSIDAQATTVDIKLDDYGLEKIEISDNGCGVQACDVPFMVKRHFTSKIVKVDDLATLETYGFRGEALASLGAVSNLTITTKRAEEDISHVYTFNKSGDVIDEKPSHLGNGTTICARKLFSNLPVRKQYYSNDQRKKDDLKKVENLVMAYSIVKPCLRITLKHGKDMIFQKTALRDTKQVIQLVFGRQVASQLIQREKCLDDPKLSISAFLPKPGSDVKDMSLSSADKTFVIVNDRPVFLPELGKILRSYYSNCHDLDNARHPLCVVSLSIPFDEVDVNVDPNKTKVFLQNKMEVKNCLEEILLEIYGPLDNVPSWHYTENDDNANKVLKHSQQDHQQRTHSIMYISPSEVSANPDETIHHNISLKDKETNQSSESNVSADPVVDATIVPSMALSSNITAVVSETDSVVSESQIQPPLLVLDTENNETKDTETSQIQRCTSTMTSVSDKNNVNSKNNLADKQVTCDDISLIDTIGTPAKVTNIVEVEASLSESSIKDNVIGMTFEDKEKTDDGIDTNAWSRGTLNLGDDLQALQPVKLLPPSSTHIPGKRPLLDDEPSTSQPSKRRSITQSPLPSNQSTLYDVLNVRPVVKPQSAFELFCEEKRSMYESSGDCGDVDEFLKDTWDNMSEKERIIYKERCWNETKRVEKEKKVTLAKNKLKQASAREEIASLASQSQAQKPKKKLKNRLYSKEVTFSCALDELKRMLSKQSDVSNQSQPYVIGCAKLCEAWFCMVKDKLALVNTHRLMELDVYNKLKAEHVLSTSPCEPIVLNSSAIGIDSVETLEKLARTNQTDDIYFVINDERLIANGFKVKCHIDMNETLSMQLVELCITVPTYGVKDIKHVLEILSQNPDAQLHETRPDKVLYYLQGEAVRMVRQSQSNKSREDIQDLLDRSVDLLCQNCLHDKPIVHNLINMSDLELEEML